MRSRFIHHLFVLLISLALCHSASAQNASRIYVEPNGWSIGMNVGMTDLWGDIGTQSFMDHYSNSKYFDKVSFMGGMFGRYTVHPCFAIRLMFNYGTLYATDKWNYDKAKASATEGTDAFQRLLRNQNAKAVVFENTLLMELTPFRINPESNRAHKRGQLFFAAGVCYFHYTPYSTVGKSSTYVNTYNLHLEGQGWGPGYPPDYSLWQLGIPMAIGYRWDLGEHLNLGIEYMYRMTFTDYLDGVSGKYVGAAAYQEHMTPKDAALAQAVADKSVYSTYISTYPNAAGNLRGNAGNKDAYSTITITFYYKVVKHTHQWWSR